MVAAQLGRRVTRLRYRILRRAYRALRDLVDPLAHGYRALRAELGMSYPIVPVGGTAEHLVRRFGPERFDLVYSSNALDHCRSPQLALSQMAAVLRPGGFLLLEGFAREGSQGGWLGLHQHDLWVEQDHLIHEDRRGRRAVLTRDLPLRCVERHVVPFEQRGIRAFGYEPPADTVPTSRPPWLQRDWYTLLLRKHRHGPDLPPRALGLAAMKAAL